MSDVVPLFLEDAARVFRQRNSVYRDNYKTVGRVMTALFPDGIQCKTAEEFERWHLFELAIVKLTRYVASYDEGGHADSLGDMINYLGMIAALDDHAREEPPE